MVYSEYFAMTVQASVNLRNAGLAGAPRKPIRDGTGASFYVKESGTGNTGWVAK